MEKGFWFKHTKVKESALPVDNITKFAYEPEDFEEVDEWYEYSKEELEENQEAKINSIKAQLADTDYIIIKIAEGVATWEDYPNIKEQRQAWRDEINKIKADS